MRKSAIWQLASASALVVVGYGCGPEADPAQDQSGVDPAVASVRAFANKHRGVMPKRDPSLAASLPKAGIVNGACSGSFQYYGGRVISNVHTIPVMWGASVNSTTKSTMTGFYQTVTNSAYWTWLSEYNTTVKPVGGGTGTNQVIGAGSSEAAITITPSITSKTVDDSQIQSELKAQIAAGHLPAVAVDSKGNANSYYAIFFPPGVSITMGGSGSCVAGGFCAYHGTISGSPEIYYGIHPDMGPGSGCDSGCGSAPTMIQNLTSVASHELGEATTDAEVGLAESNGPPLAWYDTSNGEIGDICNADQGTAGSYTVQKLWSQKSCACQDSGGTCTPACTGKTCGPDGCGGSCGTCPTGETCSANGTCGSCTPSCSGKACGPDGCGGSCGTCPTGDSCNSSGQCVPSCTPQCTGKSCGSDGCGGTCGSCPTGQTCSATGQCQGGGGQCAHSECVAGKKLKNGCDPCVTSVCSYDSYCCSSSWDSVCVDEADFDPSCSC